MQDILHRFANVTELIIELLWKLQFGCGQGFTRFQTAVNRLEVRWSLGFCLPTARDAFDVPRRLWFLCNNLYQLLSSGHSRYCGRLLHHGWLYSLAKSRFKFCVSQTRNSAYIWRLSKPSQNLKDLKDCETRYWRPHCDKGIAGHSHKQQCSCSHSDKCLVTTFAASHGERNVVTFPMCAFIPSLMGLHLTYICPFAHNGACIADKFSQRDFEWQSHTRSCKIHCAFHTFHPCRNW